jgi:hypothetical protein
MEYKEIPEKSTARISFWRRLTRHYALVVKLVVAYRLEATEGGHGLGASKYFNLIAIFPIYWFFQKKLSSVWAESR